MAAVQNVEDKEENYKDCDKVVAVAENEARGDLHGKLDSPEEN